MPALVLVGGAKPVKLDLKFLLFPLRLFVYGASKQWKEIGSIQVSGYCKQILDMLIVFGSLRTAVSHNARFLIIFFLSFNFEDVSGRGTHSEPEAERWFCGCPQYPRILWLLAACWLFPYVLGLEEGQVRC